MSSPSAPFASLMAARHVTWWQGSVKESRLGGLRGEEGVEEGEGEGEGKEVDVEEEEEGRGEEGESR